MHYPKDHNFGNNSPRSYGNNSGSYGNSGSYQGSYSMAGLRELFSMFTFNYLQLFAFF